MKTCLAVISCILFPKDSNECILRVERQSVKKLFTSIEIKILNSAQHKKVLPGWFEMELYKIVSVGFMQSPKSLHLSTWLFTCT